VWEVSGGFLELFVSGAMRAVHGGPSGFSAPGLVVEVGVSWLVTVLVSHVASLSGSVGGGGSASFDLQECACFELVGVGGRSLAGVKVWCFRVA